MSYVRRFSAYCFNVARVASLAIASPGMSKALVLREAQRGSGTFRWFTPDEAAVADALARVIVPSETDVPGLAEIDVLGPPATVVLDGLVSTSTYRPYIYSRGLYAFDLWALKKHGCKFAEMTKEDQVAMFAAAEEIDKNLAAGGSILARAWRKVRATLLARNGSFFAAKFYLQIRNDCVQVFYSSRASWIWLGYDGPPMDEGYPSVVEPR